MYIYWLAIKLIKYSFCRDNLQNMLVTSKSISSINTSKFNCEKNTPPPLFENMHACIKILPISAFKINLERESVV